jgi:uncharacterized membrane protein SpoIIM required for sporulation
MSTQDRQGPNRSSSEAARALTRTLILSFGMWALAFVAGAWSAGAVKPYASSFITPPSTEPSAPDTLRILATNLVVLLLSASGLFTFALTSVVTLLVSGLFVGVVVGVSYQDGMGLRTILWLTLPHSIELIGLWLANAVGLMGYSVGRRLVDERRSLDPRCATLFVEILVVALAVTIIAACIEGEFTLKWVVGRYV